MKSEKIDDETLDRNIDRLAIWSTAVIDPSKSETLEFDLIIGNVLENKQPYNSDEDWGCSVIGYDNNPLRWINELMMVDYKDPDRVNRLLQVKYSSHKDAPKKHNSKLHLYGENDHQTRITILLDGKGMEQYMWRGENPEEGFKICLKNPGDYISWGPGWSHHWRPCGESKMFTVSFLATKDDEQLWMEDREKETKQK